MKNEESSKSFQSSESDVVGVEWMYVEIDPFFVLRCEFFFVPESIVYSFLELFLLI